ncbi:MAG: CehA/McbA family metallohydrolase, partial [Pseudomonadota bacterium]
SHGPEYSSVEKVLEVKAGEVLDLGKITLKQINPTPGYVSADMHLHCINSPDSAILEKSRVIAAIAEGMDIIQSTDHDFLTDYGKGLSELTNAGIVLPNSIQTSIGDEVTPNHYGHLNVYPLEADESDPDHGAIDWSNSPLDEVSPAPDYGLSLDEIITEVRKDPGEEVVQINHIMDMPTGIPLAAGWVTSPHYDVDPLSSYADPIGQRMAPSSQSTFPLELGATGLMPTLDYEAIELVIGINSHDTDLFYRSALPTWFNLLNIGKVVTAVADSDSHRESANPLGLPRNYIALKTDPRDGIGDNYSDIDLEEYAVSIRNHRVVVSTGPFITVDARNKKGEIVTIGDMIKGNSIELDITVSAPSWAWFDTIDIYANTDPMPVDDKTDEPMKGVAANPATFYEPYHIPRYTYQPTKTFSLQSKTLEGWEEKDGKITAHLKYTLTASEDTWVVVMARGSKGTKGYRSLFPIAPDVLVDPKKKPENFDVNDLTSFHQSELVGANAWALSNPIFIDVDGNGFKGKFEK